MKRSLLLILVIVCLFVVGCRAEGGQATATATVTVAGDPADPLPTPDTRSLEELRAAQARWQSNPMPDYRLIVASGQPTLFCTYEVVDVQGGEVTAAWRGTRSGLCVPRADFADFDPCELKPAETGTVVADLFTIAEGYLQNAAGNACASRVDIELDQEFGFPTLAAFHGSTAAECPTDNQSETAVIAFLVDYESGYPDPYTTCGEIDPGAEPVDPILVQIGGGPGVIFSAEQSQSDALYWLFGDRRTEYWTPTEADVEALEAALPAHLQEVAEQPNSIIAERGAEGIWERLPEYTRQYVGFIRDGEQLIWANFLCGTLPPGWEQDIVLVEDGGPCYFNVIFDPAGGTFSSLDINGQS